MYVVRFERYEKVMTLVQCFLIFGAITGFVAALGHIGCMLFGAKWYLFFGAGERLAKLADEKDIRHILITSPIVIVLLIWTLYGLSGAGIIIKLPMLALGLSSISFILIMRAFVGFYFAIFNNSQAAKTNSKLFWIISSFICLAMGIAYLAYFML